MCEMEHNNKLLVGVGGGVNMREGQIYIEKHWKTEKITLSWGESSPTGGYLHVLRGCKISLSLTQVIFLQGCKNITEPNPSYAHTLN